MPEAAVPTWPRPASRPVPGLTFSLWLIAPAHGPGQSLDRYAVSPSPCAPRYTYIPVGKNGGPGGAAVR